MEIIEPLLDGLTRHVGVTGSNNRQFINGVIWIAKTGALWRDLPERLGHWYTQYTRFRRWCKEGKWQAVFEALQVKVDTEFWMVDSTIVRAHPQAAGAKNTQKLQEKRWGL